MITRVARLEHEAHVGTICRSRPGHLIHLIDKGSYRLTTNGRSYELHPGDIIYYHDGEDVVWHASAEIVVFYAVGFFAPSLKPPPLEARHLPSTPALRSCFYAAHRASLEKPGVKRDLAVYAAVHELVGSLPLEMGQTGVMERGAEVWWELERRLRQEKNYRPTLRELSEQCGRHPATLSRSCHIATGLSPLKRVQALRMEEARGHLVYGGRNVTETAGILGYGRMHEFSREYSGYFGVPPGKTKRAGGGEPSKIQQ
ncbi:MAG: helix-turn-helix domain-containing protein [Planctomycetes bacterium]|nr:helix-turn-helix domain-containing protein [Planctomycetota bacterium]